jgi:hypothetical protein
MEKGMSNPLSEAEIQWLLRMAKRYWRMVEGESTSYEPKWLFIDKKELERLEIKFESEKMR